MSVLLRHPLLGNITGLMGDGVNQYLGVKYATIANRLAEPELVGERPRDTIDATKLGPQAISSPDGCDMEQGVIQQTLSHSGFEISELEPLHLNISVPQGHWSNLPVFVWIHGGGMSSGSNAWPQYDLARLVKLSSDINMPMIGIGLNYRLGVPGFLTSERLRQRGYKANNGIRDQNVALHWIQKYISGFGGDPANVTLAGESAGGACSLYHLQSSTPLFKRVINMSGTPFLKESLLEPSAESTYTRVLRALGGDGLSADDQLKLLLETPVENFWKKLPRDVPLFPALDCDTIHKDPTFETLREGSVAEIEAAIPGRKWCEAILIGDCQLDAHALGLALKFRKPGTVAPSFVQAVSETLCSYPGAADEVLQAYGISASLPDDEVIRPILTFASDIGFYAPAVSYARAWSPNAYLYHLNEPNPWEGPNKGDCTHMFDVSLLFQNFNEKLPDQQRETGRQMAEHFIRFVKGMVPFGRYEKQNPGAMVYGPPNQGAVFVRSNDAEDFGRRPMLSKLAGKVPLDQLIVALRAFVG